MLLFPTHDPVYGIDPTLSAGPAAPAVTPDAPPLVPAARTAPADDVFGALVGLYRSNEALLAELGRVNARLRGARAYLRTPGHNPVLGGANLLHLRTRHTALLTLLRANRLRAHDLLARVGPGPIPVRV